MGREEEPDASPAQVHGVWPVGDLDATVKLNVGCGRDPMPGWTNLDISAWDGVDIVADITEHIPLDDNSVDEIRCSHTIEHVTSPLDAMTELWRVARDGARAEFHTPHGGSDIAWTDPTHLRPWFESSWTPFDQRYHWRMEQHYLADWQTDKVLLLVRNDLEVTDGLTMKRAYERIRHERNIVREMRAYLTAVKPARAPIEGWQTDPRTELVLEMEP
jgi:SAM-dependent methyltransferase